MTFKVKRTFLWLETSHLLNITVLILETKEKYIGTENVKLQEEEKKIEEQED